MPSDCNGWKLSRVFHIFAAARRSCPCCQKMLVMLCKYVERVKECFCAGECQVDPLPLKGCSANLFDIDPSIDLEVITRLWPVIRSLRKIFHNIIAFCFIISTFTTRSRKHAHNAYPTPPQPDTPFNVVVGLPSLLLLFLLHASPLCFLCLVARFLPSNPFLSSSCSLCLPAYFRPIHPHPSSSSPSPSPSVGVVALFSIPSVVAAWPQHPQ